MQGGAAVAKNLEICYLLDFYGDVLTPKQRDVMEQYYNDDFSLAEIAENFGITRQGVRDSIKRGEGILLELEQKVGFAARHRATQQSLAKLEELAAENGAEDTSAVEAIYSREIIRERLVQEKAISFVREHAVLI